MSQEVTIKLRKPIEAHGKQMTEITLRPLTGKDLRATGFPASVTSANGETKVDTEAVAGLISRLGSIPPSSVDMLSAADWVSCMAGVMSFLGASDPSSSTDGSSVLAGGEN